jgi:predicted sulfurtransferase
MKSTCAVVLIVSWAAGAGASAQQPQNPYLTPEKQEQISKMPSAGEDKRVKPEEIDSVMSKGDVILLDVREPKEIEELGGYEGAINIPVTELEKRLGELPKDKTILTA